MPRSMMTWRVVRLPAIFVVLCGASRAMIERIYFQCRRCAASPMSYLAEQTRGSGGKRPVAMGW